MGLALFEWLKTLSPSFSPFMTDLNILGGHLERAMDEGLADLGCLYRRWHLSLSI